MHFREAEVPLRLIMESSSIFQLLQGVQVGLGCLITPVGHLLTEMAPELGCRRLAIAPMSRQAAVVIAEPGWATPLSQHFFDEVRRWLATMLAE
ncbi:hypothetical protein ED28_01560 [[Pantoea] beijingensis]|uniref:LysR substrate-binding domain-containing protein n=1 Tax=[Pantoea] beijingensis TaxID=1324864 RepID=A0A443II38_9GAMM|nr:hypothetical protein ED28_01560 [[Pantoea] beijingensis]